MSGSSVFKFTVIFYISALWRVFLIDNSYCGAQELPRLEPVIVESKSGTLPFTSVSTNVVTITRDDIDRASPESLANLLQTIADISFIERGTPGAQSDISLRGSAAENVLMMINGVPVSDPQTGHFLMDIPVDIDSIDRIEIVRGGSPLYGSSSGGIVNIVTMVTDGFAGSFEIGSHCLAGTSTRFGRRTGSSAFGVSYNAGRSDGYKTDSDLEYGGFSIDGSFARALLFLDWSVGYTGKRFGAGGFYGDFPSYEKTRTVTGVLNGRIVLTGRDMIRVRIGSRGHGDDFILIRNNPAYYRNTHYNRMAILAVEFLSNRIDNLDLLFGISGERYGVTSPSLGNHADHTTGIYSGLDSHLPFADLSLSIRYDDDSRRGGVFSPNGGVAIPLGNRLKCLVNYAQTYRRPTYTDLYYISPANEGDPDLQPETMRSFDAGIAGAFGLFDFRGGFFASRTLHVIDWVRNDDAEPWRSVNHGEIVSNGFSADGRIRFGKDKDWYTSLSLMALDRTVKRKAGVVSKYALNRPLTTAVTSIGGTGFAGISMNLSARYERCEHLGSRVPVSASISRRFGNTFVSLSVANAANEHYEAFPRYFAPGRWIRCSLRWGTGPS